MSADRQRYVYFGASDGLVKIGTSVDVATRLRSLRADFLAAIPGGFADERAMHRRFAHARVSGEWFTPCDEITAYLAALPDSARRVPAPSRSQFERMVWYPSEVAAMLGRPTSEIIRRCASGDLPSIRVGSHWRIPKARFDVDAVAS